MKKSACAAAATLRRLHTRVIISGLLLLYVTLVAQTTSRFTPYVAYYPPLFDVFSRLGTILLVIAAALYLAAYYRSSRNMYLAPAALAGIAAFVTVANVWGVAFQLSIAGITTGGSLLVLGAIDFHNRTKR